MYVMFYLQLCAATRTLPYRGHNRDADTRYAWMRCSWSDKHWTHKGHSTCRWNQNEKPYIIIQITTKKNITVYKDKEILVYGTADDTIIRTDTNWCKYKSINNTIQPRFEIWKIFATAYIDTYVCTYTEQHELTRNTL